MRPRNFQQDPGEEVHPGWKRVEVVDGLEQPILQVGRIAQPHPVEAEIELKTEPMEGQTTRREGERDDRVFTPATVDCWLLPHASRRL